MAVCTGELSQWKKPPLLRHHRSLQLEILPEQNQDLHNVGGSDADALGDNVHMDEALGVKKAMTISLVRLACTLALMGPFSLTIWTAFAS